MRAVRAVLLAVAALAAAGHAQVVQVRNTGCPNAGWPKHNATARIGQTFQFSWGCAGSEVAFGVFGRPSGGGLKFGRPYTCVAGPCTFYVAPAIGATYVWFPILGRLGNWRLPIPNDPSLLFSTWSVQAGCWRSSGPCFTLSGALSMAIGR